MTRVHRGPTPKRSSLSHTRLTIEAIVAQGLTGVAAREITDRLAHRVEVERIGAASILFVYSGQLGALLSLQTVSSLYLVTRFDVPRPRALLGDENLRRLLATIATVRALWPVDSFETLHLSAAGARSAVMRRLLEAIAQDTGLRVAPDEGNLQLRVRRADAAEGWEVLIRLSPRPLSARSWRVCDMPGALNAAVAAAMVSLTNPDGRQVFLNPACGSGTLLIERAEMGPAGRIVGFDISHEALACARKNTRGFGGRIEIYEGDAAHLPFGNDEADAICIDPPFGHRVGDHASNRELYPAMMREAARVARTGALCCILTHQGPLMDGILRESGAWVVERRSRVHLGGLIPTLFLLRLGL